MMRVRECDDWEIKDDQGVVVMVMGVPVARKYIGNATDRIRKCDDSR